MHILWQNLEFNSKFLSKVFVQSEWFRSADKLQQEFYRDLRPNWFLKFPIRRKLKKKTTKQRKFSISVTIKFEKEVELEFIS